MVEIIPLGENVLIEVDRVEEKTAGGIHLPSQLTDKQNNAQIKGTVLKKGKGAWEDYLEGWDVPAEGDRVYISRNSGYIVDRDENIRLCRDCDVQAIIKE